MAECFKGCKRLGRSNRLKSGTDVSNMSSCARRILSEINIPKNKSTINLQVRGAATYSLVLARPLTYHTTSK